MNCINCGHRVIKIGDGQYVHDPITTPGESHLPKRYIATQRGGACDVPGCRCPTAIVTEAKTEQAKLGAFTDDSPTEGQKEE